MIGKVYGYLIVGLFCLTLTAVLGIVAFVDLDRPWIATRLWIDEHVPALSRRPEKQERTVRVRPSIQVRWLAGAAFRAIKSGKARPADLFDLGRLYYQAQRDGHLDSAEFGRLVDLAQKTGIMDELIQETPNSAAMAGGMTKATNGINRDGNIGVSISQLQSLLTAFEQTRADGHIDTGEMVHLLEQARASGIEEQLATMLPQGYDETRAREAARNLFSAVAGGEVSLSQMGPLIQMFTQAQADGRLDQQELDRLVQATESLVR